ncbi:MAG: hypothetical protein NT164_06945 [Verrucomicrobiae bacterium]|nr:hypothetical protein [Verrucomicrobiae bacterium]
MRSASPVELMTNADAYEKVAHSFEQAATCQEAIHALPDIPSKVKSQKTFKERAQVFLEQAQKLHAKALEQLQGNNASAAEDVLGHARLELEKVGKAVDAARAAAAKAAGTSV